MDRCETRCVVACMNVITVRDQSGVWRSSRLVLVLDGFLVLVFVLVVDEFVIVTFRGLFNNTLLVLGGGKGTLLHRSGAWVRVRG